MMTAFAPTPALAQTNVVYFTRFEPSEGFDITKPLGGQGGWLAAGPDQYLQQGGNGIVTNFFEGEGQQAYVGFSALSGSNDMVNAWRPLNYSPLTSGAPLVKFTVSMAIFDSTVAFYDSFRWSVYNTNGGGQRLFSIDFENTTTNICYLLDDNVFVPTGYAYEPADGSGIGLYDLEVTMNFASNRWSAALNGTLIVDQKPMTTKGSALNLGDVDAVWVQQVPGSPGDNFMVFDNYRITSEASAPMPAQLTAIAGPVGGVFVLRLQGESGRQYAIDASDDLSTWTALKTNVVGLDGTFDFADTTAGGSRHRMYRGRFVP
jgi:hypothetical protein